MKILIIIITLLSFKLYAQGIVSTSPALTEILTELGLEAKIVGRTKYCLDAKKAMVIGTALKLDYEKLISLNPDIVLLQENSPSQSSKDLKELGLTFKSFKLVNVSDISSTINSLAEHFEINPKDVLNKLHLSGSSKFKNGFIMLGGIPGKSMMVAGTDSYYSEIASKLGMKNLASSKGWPKITPELARGVVDNNSVIIEVSTSKNNQWSKSDWDSFCPKCNVLSFVSARSAFPGVTVISKLSKVLVSGGKDD